MLNMLPNRRLSDYLPIRFATGEQVRQFSKPCVHCGQMLNAQHMQGIARLVKGYIAIAAKAHCPACDEGFPVVCLIDEEKRVQRVVIPHFLFNPYLRALPTQPEENVRQQNSAPDFVPAQPETVAVPVSASQIQKSDEAVGRYQGNPIPAWVRVDGQLFAFDRVVQDAQAAQGEFLLEGCLVYRLDAEKIR